MLRLETFKLSEENVGGNFQDSGIDMEFCLRPQNHREKKKAKLDTGDYIKQKPSSIEKAKNEWCAETAYRVGNSILKLYIWKMVDTQNT